MTLYAEFKRGNFVRHRARDLAGPLGIVVETQDNGVRVQWSNGDYGWWDRQLLRLETNGENASGAPKDWKPDPWHNTDGEAE